MEEASAPKLVSNGAGSRWGRGEQHAPVSSHPGHGAGLALSRAMESPKNAPLPRAAAPRRPEPPRQKRTELRRLVRLPRTGTKFCKNLKLFIHWSALALRSPCGWSVNYLQ